MILEDIVQAQELKELISQGKTLQEVSDLVYERCGRRWSTAGVSKLCKKYAIPMPRSGPRSGSLHKGWKGGRAVNKDGYVEVYCPHHPNARKHTRYILEHRLVMEGVLGRFLTKKEVVHHKNGVKDDNRPENLELFQSNKEHLAETLKGKIPHWSEEGKAKIAAGQKTKGKPRFSESTLRRRRCLCLLRNAIQGELKLRVVPNKAQCLHYLAQFGMSFQQACDMVVMHGLERGSLRPMLEREMARQSLKPCG